MKKLISKASLLRANKKDGIYHRNLDKPMATEQLQKLAEAKLSSITSDVKELLHSDFQTWVTPCAVILQKECSKSQALKVAREINIPSFYKEVEAQF